MSLINQMLKDLAKREKLSVDPEVALSGLISPSVWRDVKRTRFRYGVSFLFFMSTIFLIVSHQLTHKKILPVANTHVVQQPIQEALPPPNLEKEMPLAAPITSALLNGVSLETHDDQTELRFLLTQNDVPYTLTSNADQTKLILTLKHTNLTADMPPVDYVKSAMTGMQMTNDSEGNLKITLDVHPGASLNYLDMVSSDKSPELRLTFSYHASSENVTGNFSVKKTDEFNAKTTYENAMNFAKIGEKNKAILLLSDLIDEYPNYVTARESLVNLLLQGERKVKARQVLEEGLRLKPYFPPFIEMKARLLVMEGKNIQALSLLERAPPPVNEYPEYHAFIAALYRDQGQTLRALQIYQELVRLYPMNAVFWAGLGITLESNDEEAAAKEAYEHAMQLNGLTTPLEEYVESRLQNI